MDLNEFVYKTLELLKSATTTVRTDITLKRQHLSHSERSLLNTIFITFNYFSINTDMFYKYIRGAKP